MTALFLIAPAYGHLNATYRLARQLQTEGYQVQYAYNGPAELAQRIAQQGFGIHWLQSQPFGTGIDEIQHKSRSESYLETLIDRITGHNLKTRTADWQQTLALLKPQLILIDAFLSTDFIVLYPLLAMYPAKVVLIQTMLSTYNDGQTPPLNSRLIPGQARSNTIRSEWRKQYWLRKLWRIGQTIKYLGFSPNRQVRRAFRQNGLPETHRLRDDKVFHAGIDNLPEWIMPPREFDFAGRQILPHQQYLGLMPDLDRHEEQSVAYENLIAKLQQERQANPNQKLLYASLGTVTEAHVKSRVVLRFFEQLLRVVAAQPNWQLVIAAGPGLIAKLPNLPRNVYVLAQVPQLHLLQQSDLFITHGGLNSVLEAATLNIPMLVYPLNRRWDQPGNAARVVAQGKGLMGDLQKVTATAMTRQITHCLTMVEQQSV